LGIRYIAYREQIQQNYIILALNRLYNNIQDMNPKLPIILS